MKIGYARVSTLDQNLDLQTDALTAAGCEEIYTDKITGTKADRPALNELLSFARRGDTIIIWKLDRLGRSLSDLISIVADLEKKGINFVCLKESFDTTTAAGKLFFQMSACFAEYEKNILKERTLAGLAAAKARGRTGGRKRALSDSQIKEINGHYEYLCGELNPDLSKFFAESARIFKTSERTIRRVINGEY